MKAIYRKKLDPGNKQQILTAANASKFAIKLVL